MAVWLGWQTLDSNSGSNNYCVNLGKLLNNSESVIGSYLKEKKSMVITGFVALGCCEG